MEKVKLVYYEHLFIKHKYPINKKRACLNIFNKYFKIDYKRKIKLAKIILLKLNIGTYNKNQVCLEKKSYKIKYSIGV